VCQPHGWTRTAGKPCHAAAASPLGIVHILRAGVLRPGLVPSRKAAHQNGTVGCNPIFLLKGFSVGFALNLRNTTVHFTPESFYAWPTKRITLLGMSGVGKTRISTLLRAQG
jgi:hypothetical protein